MRAVMAGPTASKNSCESGFALPHRERLEANHCGGHDEADRRRKTLAGCESVSALEHAPAVMSFRDPEPRLRDITIRQLLQHTGGWDRDKSFDPMFRSERIASATNTPPPATAVNVIRYMLSRELDFDPGTRYAYSNYGYCVLGRLIEKLSGKPTRTSSAKEFSRPSASREMRIGASLDGKQAPGEVRYYTGDERWRRTSFPGGPVKVPRLTEDFISKRWMRTADGSRPPSISLASRQRWTDPERSPLLKPKLFPAMYAPPPPPVSRNKEGTLGKHLLRMRLDGAAERAKWPPKLLAQRQPAGNVHVAGAPRRWFELGGFVQSTFGGQKIAGCSDRCRSASRGSPRREMAGREFVFRLEVIVLKANVRPVVSERVLEISELHPGALRTALPASRPEITSDNGLPKITHYGSPMNTRPV